MSKSISTPVATALCAALLLPLCCGCLNLVHYQRSSSTQLVGGSSFNLHSLQEIVPGKTPESWLTSTLGKPQYSQVVEPGVRLHRYGVVQETKSSGGIMFMFSYAGDSKEMVTYNFKVREGVIESYWCDTTRI